MATLTVDVSEDRIVALVEQLSPSAKQAILRRLITDVDEWDAMTDIGEARVREVCRLRGIDWDSLSETERTALIDQLLHEA